MNRKWTGQSIVGHKYPVWQSDSGKRHDLIVIDKKEQKEIMIDIAVPTDVRVGEEEKEKLEKYQDLKKEIRRLWKLRNIEIVPVIIRALGSVSAEFIGGWESYS